MTGVERAPRTPGVVVRGLLDLARPGNALAAGALTAIGAYVAGGAADAPAAVVTAAVATVLATAAGMAINDYVDRSVDRVNRPDRAIPRGAVTPREALAFGAGCFVLAVVLVLTLPPLAVAIAVVNLVALVTYTPWFKGRPAAGNALVAYLGGSTFLFGGAAVGDVGAAAVLFVLAALATFAREVVKDVEDLVGDEAAGLRTLPVVWGDRRALWLAAVVLVVGVLASPWPWLDGTFGLGYLVLVVPADLVMLAAVAEAFADPTAGQTHLKYGTYLAALAFLVGRAFA